MKNNHLPKIGKPAALDDGRLIANIFLRSLHDYGTAETVGVIFGGKLYELFSRTLDQSDREDATARIDGFAEVIGAALLRAVENGKEGGASPFFSCSEN